MPDSSIAGTLFAGAVPGIPLDASYYQLKQRVDHKGRPKGKPECGHWHFVTSWLTQQQFEQLTHYALSHTACFDAHAEYGRSDGLGAFVTVWGTGCYLVGWREEFDARGTNGREASHRVHLTFSPQEMGRQAGAKGEFVAPVSREYEYARAQDEKKASSPPTDIIGILFSNNSLVEIRNNIATGIIPRRYPELISVEEQAVIAYYTTKEGYIALNSALIGGSPMNPFIEAQEKILKEALEKLPKLDGNTIRGAGHKETGFLNDSSIGDIITYNNFASSSLDEGIADDFMERKEGEYILRIKSKKGVPISEISFAPYEDEVLFTSKTQFRVISKTYRLRVMESDPLVKEIYLEEV